MNPKCVNTVYRSVAMRNNVRAAVCAVDENTAIILVPPDEAEAGHVETRNSHLVGHRRTSVATTMGAVAAPARDDSVDGAHPPMPACTPAGSVSEKIPASIPPTAVFAFFRGGPWRALGFNLALASFHFNAFHHAIIRLSYLFKTHIRFLPGRPCKTARLCYQSQGSREGFEACSQNQTTRFTR